MERTLRTESGFGLLSTIVAMVLLGVAVAALSSSGVFLMAIQTETGTRSTATAIAASYLEEIKARAPQALKSETALAVNEDGVVDATGRYLRSVEVVPAEDLPFTKRITVRVGYPRGRGRTGTVELVTLIYVGEGQ